MHDRTNSDSFHALGDQLSNHRHIEVRALGEHNLTIDLDVLGQYPGRHRGIHVVDQLQRAICGPLGDGQRKANAGPTVDVTHDQVLGHVDESTCQVTGVRRS